MESMVESLRRQREQLAHGADEEALRRHMSLLEIAVISLHNRLVNRMASESERFRSSGAILAMGHFGRGLLGPQDPVSLLWLRAETFPWDESAQREIVAPLVEAGWQVSLQCATIPELLEELESRRDFFFELLDTRYLSGNRQLAAELDHALDDFIASHQRALFDLLYHGIRGRQARFSIPENWLEPDMLESPGALKDIDSIRFAGRILLDVHCFDDAIFQGYLTRREVDRLQSAEKKLLKWLNLLRSVKGHRHSVLDFKVQEILAEKLGYSGRSGFLPVESFMQEVHETLHEVFCVSSEFCERLQEIGKIGSAPVSLGPKVKVEEGLFLVGGRLHVDPGRVEPTAANLVRLYALAAQHRVGFSSATRRWLEHHRSVVETAFEDPGVLKAFLQLLASDDGHVTVIRRFYNDGFLRALVPESALVHALVQHDAFHVYPVHEHHLRTLRELKRLKIGEYQDEEPELTALAQEMADNPWLSLAALFHDLGKHAGHHHAKHGADMFPLIARRLGMSSDGADLVTFLIRHHLLLMDTASMRDLGDMELLIQCARTVEDLEKLHLLMLLSFADMMATGPRAVQKWRETPVHELYRRLLDLLEKGEPGEKVLAERLQRLKEAVCEKVADVVDPSRLEEHFRDLPPRYVLTSSPKAVARHLRLEMELGPEPDAFVWEVEKENGGVEITVLSREIPGFLAKVAGILTLHDLDIRDARVFTKKNGVMILVFGCRFVIPRQEAPDWASVRADLRRLLQGRLALDYRIAAHAAAKGSSPVRTLIPSPSRVLLDNDSAKEYTIVEVYTMDRPGLLYTITRTLLDLQVRIHVAKITTKVDQVADIFYIKNHRGEKVTDREQVEELRRALLFYLDGPAVFQA
ncbi:[protein-PII] uridylyltransferase family protein [Desulfosoma caldarium]|uniref:Bifunctional uridylyltransferase/uridylyl-removing enzyme n=1 Tax=Desulfosoma caldarium TaxID=610254 RepID=A0A3N1UDQ9_9BACT|nr:HD domain-containing protein [Desulfosoma caldarium]ROQ89545.1 [protein-PII] uridylyltransferase [Desulfosoma caldarium]